MEQIKDNNRVSISGFMDSPFQFSHSLHGEGFYLFTMRIPRLSHVDDVLPVTASERLIYGNVPVLGDRLYIEGQLRSYNKHVEGMNRLIITIFARKIEKFEDDKFMNQIQLDGFVCKPPIYRTTPFQREITDILLAVNRSYNKSDYLPCIAWGRNARFASQLDVGNRILVGGRIQSREYQKTLENGEIVPRTAYEVSISKIEMKDDKN